MAQASCQTKAALVAAVADKEKQEAETRAAEAHRAAITAHPAVREAAGLNRALAEENARVNATLEAVRGELARHDTLREELEGQYAETRRRAEEAPFTPAIGMMLRSQ